MVPDHDLVAPPFQEAPEVVEAGVGAVQLDEGGLDQYKIPGGPVPPRPRKRGIRICSFRYYL
jgi:hypothetical protein